MIAALFVDPKGPYANRSDVDAWDECRDARNYVGSLPVVAHPPCGRWCRLAKLVESRYPHLKVGDDGGCFSAAVRIVHHWGGVLEHPAWSLAWAKHNLIAPDVGGWTGTVNYDYGERAWVCEINQAAYGHDATKATWLYYVGKNPPAPMNWARKTGTRTVGGCRKRGDGTIWKNRMPEMTHSQRHITPPAFAEALISLARNCGGAP